MIDQKGLLELIVGFKRLLQLDSIFTVGDLSHPHAMPDFGGNFAGLSKCIIAQRAEIRRERFGISLLRKSGDLNRPDGPRL